MLLEKEQLMQEEKWLADSVTEHEIQYTGLYVTSNYTYTGKIITKVNSSDKITVEAFIHNPPQTTHPKKNCLHHIKGGWFSVHWAGVPTTAIDALIYLNGLLQEMENLQ